jgi:iron complex outermembrane receptor protein
MPSLHPQSVLSRCTLTLSLGLALAAGALAGEPAPSLAGRVVDRSGDPVPAAVVRLRCAGEAAATELVADRLGRFRAEPPTGCTPELAASLAGERSDVPFVAVDPASDLELTLDVDLFRDRIDVQATAVSDSVGSREVRESFALDAGEAAARVPGVSRLRKGGIAADLVVRGLHGNDVTVLVDGHRLHGACPNRMDPPAFHVDFAEIERIDVAKSPADAPGGGALASTVHIVTRRPEPGLHVDAQATAGAFGYLAPSASVSWADARWSARAGWAMRRGDAYEDGDGQLFTAALPAGSPAAYRDAAQQGRAFDIGTSWLGLALTPTAGQRFELDATRQRAESQLYPYLRMDASRDDADRARFGWSLERAAGRLRRVEAAVSRPGGRHDMDDRLRLSSGISPFGWSMRSEADSETVDERLVVELAGGWSAGVEGWQRDWSVDTAMAMMGQLRIQPMLPDTELDGTAAWVRLARPLADRVTLRGAARFERVETGARAGAAERALWAAYHPGSVGEGAVSRRDDELSGQLGLAWQPTAAWELTAGLARGVRAPDPQERYTALRRADADWVGNPALDPAINDQLDLGMRWGGERFSLDVDAFASRLGDAITVVETARAAMQPGVMNSRARSWVNHDTLLWGAEGTARWILGRRTTLVASAAWVDGARDLDPARGIVDRDPAELPPLSGRLALRYDPGPWFVEVEQSAAARQSQVDSGLGETPTPGWSITDLRAGWQRGRLALTAGVTNLFDRAYREHLSYQRDPFRAGYPVAEPGRGFVLGVRLRT